MEVSRPLRSSWKKCVLAVCSVRKCNWSSLQFESKPTVLTPGLGKWNINRGKHATVSRINKDDLPLQHHLFFLTQRGQYYSLLFVLSSDKQQARISACSEHQLTKVPRQSSPRPTYSCDRHLIRHA